MEDFLKSILNKDMNLEFFPHFVRANYPGVEIANKECQEIGKDFKKYLQNKFKGKEEKLQAIWNIDLLNVILNEEHPFRVNGYHPALVLHFTNFIEEEKNKIIEKEKLS